MKKIALAVIIGLILISTSTFTASSTEVKAQDDDDVFYMAATYGPAWLRIFTDIEITDGDQEQIDKIDELLTRQKFQMSAQRAVAVEQMTFTVTYKLPTRLFSRFHHRTLYTEIDLAQFEKFQDVENFQDFKDLINNTLKGFMENTSYNLCRRQSITYENFTGSFVLFNTKTIRGFRMFRPTKFCFVGVCENLVVD